MLMIAHLIILSLAATAYTVLNGAGALVPVLHVLVVGGVLTSLAQFRWCVHSQFDAPLARCLGAAIGACFGGVFAGDLVLLMLNIISSAMTGHPLEWNVIEEMARIAYQVLFPELPLAEGMTMYFVALVSGVVVVLLLAVSSIGIYGWLFSRPARAHRLAEATDIAPPRRSLGLALLAALLALLPVAAFGLTYDREPPNIWDGDPIAELLTRNTARFTSEYRRAVGAVDLEARAAYDAQPTHTPNIIVFVVDTMRADHTFVKGYERETMPYLARLHAEGQLGSVDHFYANCQASICGIPGMLGSKYFRDVSRDSFKVHELLSDIGYETYFVLSGMHAWFGLQELYGDSIDHYIDDTNIALMMGSTEQRADDLLIPSAIELLETPADTPVFFFIHLMSAHMAGLRHPEFNHWRPSALPDITPDNEAEIRINRYDNGLLQADSVIERALAALREKGVLDDAIVLITADHGEALGEHHQFGHQSRLYNENIEIPLFYMGEPRLDEVVFGTLFDFAPTVVELLGMPVPDVWAGVSMLSAPPNRCSIIEAYTFKGKMGIQGVLCRDRGRIFKYVNNNSRIAVMKESELFFDLTADPDELVDLSKEVAPLQLLPYRHLLREYRAQYQD